MIALLTLTLAACASPNPTPTPTATLINTPAPIISPMPLSTRTPLPTLTPSNAPEIGNSGTLVTAVAAIATNTPNPNATSRPTSTSALLASSPTIDPVLQATLMATMLPSPAVLPGNAPPLTIQLPAGWKSIYRIVPIRDQFTGDYVQSSMSVATYSGPLGNGAQGTIDVLWGFPSIGPAPTLSGVNTPDMISTIGPALQSDLIYADGSRLLQGTEVDITCNVGNYGKQDFTIGGMPAVGAYFAAVQCQGEPDTLGWFAGVHQFNTNFLFYAYIDPSSAYADQKGPLQRILDTVQFHQPTPVSVGGTPILTNTPSGSPVPPTTTPALH